MISKERGQKSDRARSRGLTGLARCSHPLSPAPARASYNCINGDFMCIERKKLSRGHLRYEFFISSQIRNARSALDDSNKEIGSVSNHYE
jgi:hypothetical protein